MKKRTTRNGIYVTAEHLQREKVADCLVEAAFLVKQGHMDVDALITMSLAVLWFTRMDADNKVCDKAIAKLKKSAKEREKDADGGRDQDGDGARAPAAEGEGTDV